MMKLLLILLTVALVCNCYFQYKTYKFQEQAAITQQLVAESMQVLRQDIKLNRVYINLNTQARYLIEQVQKDLVLNNADITPEKRSQYNEIYEQTEQIYKQLQYDKE